MALSLSRWPLMTTAEKLADAYNLTSTRVLANSSASSPTTVTFLIRCGEYQKGESAALPPAEAAAVTGAGFAQ